MGQTVEAMNNSIFKILFRVSLEYDIFIFIELRIGMKDSFVVLIFDLTHSVTLQIIHEKGCIENSSQSFPPILRHSIESKLRRALIRIVYIG